MLTALRCLRALRLVKILGVKIERSKPVQNGGTLNIIDGGAVSNSEERFGLGSDFTGAVMVDGGGAAWSNSSDLTVGYIDSGSLKIANGTTVTNDAVHIGDYSSSIDVVTVDGPDSPWANEDGLAIGRQESAHRPKTRKPLSQHC